MTLKKIMTGIAVGVIFLVVMTVFYPHIACASGADIIQANLDYMLQVYPSGSYFSKDGKACGHVQEISCSNCQLRNIPSRGGLPSGNNVGTTDGATCVGFAKYAFYCLSGAIWPDPNNTVYTNVPYSQVYQKAKLGDYISYSGHAGIYLSGDSSGYWMYEANYTTTNQVMYRGYKHKEGPCKIVHAYCYEYPVPLNNDTEPPTISNVRVTNLTKAGYTVTCNVSDNVGVTRVMFPTWYEGQQGENAIWLTGTVSGNTASVTVNVSDYGGKTNLNYHTHIYAYDAAGNSGMNGDAVYNFVDSTPPVISDVRISNVTSKGYKVSCLVTDNGTISKVQFPTWTSNGGSNIQDDLLWHDAVKGADGRWSATIQTSQHNNETGCNYITHLYAWDKCGNQGFNGYGIISVPAIDTEKPVITNAQITNVSPDGFTVTCNISDNTGVTRVRFPTWTVHGVADEQDDLFWHEGTISGNTASCRINVSDHNNERDCGYRVHIYAYDAEGNYTAVNICTEGNIWVPGLPGKPIVSYMSAGDGSDLYQVTFSWNETANTTHYDIRLYDKDGNNFWGKQNLNKTSYTVLLPAGSYSMNIAAVNADYDVWSTSNRVSFSINAGTVPPSGELISIQEGDHQLYKLFQSDCTWAGAKAIAEKDGGNLAIIHNQKQQDAVTMLMADSSFNAWIGAYGWKRWQWYDEIGFTFTNWAPDEPDNVEDPEKICAQALSGTGMWASVPNDSDQNGGYILEYEPVSLIVVTRKDKFSTRFLPTMDDLSVSVVFGDGTVLETSDYTMELSGTELGEQTVSVIYGSVSESFPISIVESIPDPDFILPAELTLIESEAFSGLAMEVVMCPEALEEIGTKAFENCGSLRHIYIPQSTTSIARNAFEGCTDLTIWGRTGSVAQAYATAKGFSFMEYVD